MNVKSINQSKQTKYMNFHPICGARQPVGIVNYERKLADQKTIWSFLQNKQMIFMRLNLTILFTVLLVAQVVANGFAQKMSLDYDQADLKIILRAIKKKTGYNIIYRSDQIRDAGKISIHIKDTPLDAALTQVLVNTKLAYIIKDTVIVIKSNNAKIPNSIGSNTINLLDINGKVIDELGKPLIGATIKVKGTSLSTITNTEGRFNITVPDEGGVLIISYIGYSEQQLPVGKSNLKPEIVLKLEENLMKDVVVVGYGTQKKASLTSAVSSISSKELEGRPTPSVINSLQGQVPGLNITQTSAQPGFSQTSINIRGISSLSNNPVLLVIDGVPSTLSLNDLSPTDIDNIAVLKDASATSIYGARGSGGVLLITTKTGKNKNGKPTISYDGNTGIQKTTRLPIFVDAPEYVDLVNTAIQNDNPGATPRFDAATIQKYKSGELPSTNWIQLILNKRAIQQQHTISVSGAEDKVNYFLSGSILNQGALMDNVGYKRKNLRANVNAKLTDNFEVGINSSYISGDRWQPTVGGGLAAALGWSYYVPVTEFPYTASGLPRTFRGGWTPYQAIYQGGTDSYDDNTFSNIITATYKPVTGLELKGVYSYLYSTTNQTNQQKPISVYYDDGSPGYSAPATPILAKTNSFNKNPNLILTATYTNSFGNHNFKLLGGYSHESLYSELNTSSRAGFLSNDILQIDGGNNDRTLWGIGGRATEWALSSGFGRINYDYKGKYLVEANGRVDGSSRFYNKRIGFFPSVSAGWVISNESFFHQNKTLNFLKLRASYGSVGNQSALGETALYPFAAILGTGQYALNNAQFQTTNYLNIPNYDLTWETKTTSNIGLDANLLNDHLNVTIELYNERTTGIIRTPTVATTFGASAPYLNSGIFQNRGYEINLSYQNIINDLKYSVGVNFSDNRNKIISLGGTAPTINDNPLQESHSRWEWFGYQAEGLFQSQAEINSHAVQPNQASLRPGDIKLKDINGDNVVNANDRIILGEAQPHYYYGFNGKLSFKSFDLSFLFQGVLQNLKNLGSGVASPFATATGNILKSQTDTWTPSNTDARYPLLRINQSVNYGALSSWSLYKAQYLRLKNLQIGYNIPTTFAQKIKLKSLRIFLTGENLFTLTPKGYPKEIDPELSNYDGIGNYPQLKVFSLGLHVDL